MVYVVAEYKVKQEKRKDFLTAAIMLQSQSQQEGGCKIYKLVQKDGEDNTFAFFEIWRCPQSLNLHKNMRHYQQLVPVLEACSDSFEVKMYS